MNDIATDRYIFHNLPLFDDHHLPLTTFLNGMSCPQSGNPRSLQDTMEGFAQALSAWQLQLQPDRYPGGLSGM